MKKIYSLLLLTALCLFGAQSLKATTVYFVNTSGWSADNVKCYAFTDDPSAHNVDWPGAKMTATGTQVGGYDVYSCDVASFEKCIFNDNGNNTTQTPDQVIDAATPYCLYLGNEWPNAVWYASTAAIEADASKFHHMYVRGSMNDGWGLENPMTQVSTNIWKADLTLAAGTYTFKFDAGKWNNASTISGTGSSDVVLSMNTLGNGVVGAGQNFKVSELAAGTYTFILDVTGATPKVAVTDGTTYTVTYNGHGETSGSVSDVNTYNFYDVATVLGQGTLKKKGYTFANWTTEENGSGDAYNMGGKITMTGDVNLYAQWDALPAASVALEADASHVLTGTTINLTATPTNFVGDILYTYSYSLDGGAYQTIAEDVTSATSQFEIPAANSGTYTFKVVATHEAEDQTAENTYNVYAAKSWTVGGSYESIFGVEWADNEPTNHMVATATPGVFTLTKNRVFVYAGTLYYKVFKDDSNVISYGKSGGNQDYYFATAGYYDIVFTFNWNTEEVSATPTYLYPKVVISGGITGDAAVELSDYDEGVLSKSIAISAGVHNGDAGFMMTVNEGTANGYMNTVYRDNCSNWLLNDPSNKCGIMADVTGNYLFSYVVSTGKLNFGYPESFTRPASANYGSLCVPFTAELDNAYAYQITSQANDVVTITKVETDLVAGHSYIIKAIDPAQPITVSKVNNGSVAGGPTNDDYHYGVLGASVVLTDANADVYVLSGNKLCPIGTGSEVTVVSTKAYFKLPAAASAPAGFRIVEAENNTTAIDNIEANDEAVKFIQDGKLFILRGGITYDVTGCVVK